MIPSFNVAVRSSLPVRSASVPQRAPRVQPRRSYSSASWTNGARLVKPNIWDRYPSNVGILALDAYFPKNFVKQSDLETFDGVGKGKYTLGLEQDGMAFTGDREDIYSMALTAVQNLMEKYNIDYKDIGRLEVGTETVLDKSKSIKTVLMTLFEKSGNFNVEGIDTINACYGGTSALLNAINWVESSSWDGRYALVVCGDIAVYSPGPARPTGGAGVVAMLVGRDAPIVMERGIRGSHMEHVYDFYKPNMSSEYPLVDGPLSIVCYFRSIDNCYNYYRKTFEQHYADKFSMDKADYAIFHSPYTKLVRKSFARLHYLDYLNGSTSPKYSNVPEKLKSLSVEDSYKDKELEKLFGELTKGDYAAKVEPSSLLPKQLGNTYTGSLYAGLLSLIAQKEDKDLVNKRVVMFSYGSGSAATMFSLGISGSVKKIRDTSRILERLAERVPVAPEEYTKVMKLREDTHHLGNYNPVTSTDTLFPGTYYLEKVDAEKRRFYARK